MVLDGKWNLSCSALDNDISMDVPGNFEDALFKSGIIDDQFGAARSIPRQYLSRHIRDIAGRFSGAPSDAKELFD